jgi:predicted MPP superfamily phosphohydrolase
VLAATVATARGARRVRLYENGVVSFGLPIAAQVLGARAPRTTHPRAMHLTATLFRAIGLDVPLENPFLWRTKAEVVRGLGELGAMELLEATMSCSRFARGLTSARARPRSCGLCSACIDRRFATLAAGAAAFDPAARYEVDLLVGARPEGPSRALVDSYVRAAMELADLGDSSFFTHFGEATRVLRLVAEQERAKVADVAAKLVDLHLRHGEQVEGVLDDGIRRHARALRTGRLPKSSLLRACLPSEPPPRDEAPPHARASAARSPSPSPSRSAHAPAATTPPDMPIRILHLSDLHVSARRAWDQDPVLSGLARDVAGLVKSVGPIDLVALTGDVAERGADAEYALARQWLEGALLPAAGVARERLFIVPGNHDVERGAVNRMVQSLQRDLLKAESEEAIAEVLADPQQRDALLARHAPFTRFVEALGVPRGDGAPWWSTTLEVRGVRVHVAALDTAWASFCDDDKGRLLISRYQAHAALRDVERADLAIALMHHPWDDLAEFDAREVREAVLRRCKLVLRGHLHQAEGRALHRPDLAALELACGACYAGSKYANAYHLIELATAGDAARVHLRLWDGHDWIADRNAYRGHAQSGVASFALGPAK